MDTSAHRASFASLLANAAGISAQSEIAAAFASTPREDFIGPPPWRIFTTHGEVGPLSDDPALLYQDVMVSLKRGGSLNNGQPSLHAICLAALTPKRGDYVVHVGAGTGYYTMLLAKLVAPTGSVEAFEIDIGLAERAKNNLLSAAHVTVHARSGTEGPLPACDVLYVSAGATSPLNIWLDALRPNGRLLFPLTPDAGAGGMLLVTRKPDKTYSARFLCRAMFVPCIGARDATSEQRLAEAFSRGRFSQVKSLYRDNSPDRTAWCSGEDWWLSTQALKISAED